MRIRNSVFSAIVMAALGIGCLAPSPARASGATLYWTAPGDDGMVGTATRYDLRYSLTPITTTTWSLATRVTLGFNPSPPGTLESVSVGGLLNDVTYYFAIRTADERGNWSGISNTCVFVDKTAGAGGPEYRLDLASPRPNPSRDRASFALTLPVEGSVMAVVIDATGRLVRSLANERRPAGPNDLIWDLRRDDGGQAAAGIYWVRVRAAGRTLTRQLVVMR